MEWVVRAGVAAARSLIRGYREHAGVPNLFGFSVQYAPGKTVEDLARAGQFPHSQISVAADDALAAVLAPLGYEMRLVRSPGKGFHHTFAVLYDARGIPLRMLPDDAARALSVTFRQRPNPFPTP